MEEDDSLQPSAAVQALMGTQAPCNTRRANRTALKLLAKYVIDGTYIDCFFRTEPHMRSILTGSAKHAPISSPGQASAAKQSGGEISGISGIQATTVNVTINNFPKPEEK